MIHLDETQTLLQDSVQAFHARQSGPARVRRLRDQAIPFDRVVWRDMAEAGWLGVLVPKGRIETITSKILPSSIASNSYVDNLVRPPFAEVQTPYGSPITFNRPSAPFAYTNGWGVNYTLMIFVAFAMLALFHSQLARGP